MTMKYKYDEKQKTKEKELQLVFASCSLNVLVETVINESYKHLKSIQIDFNKTDLRQTV